MDIGFKQSNLNTSISALPHIDYSLLAKAQDYYSKDFTQCETPWFVPVEYNELTKPHDETSFYLTNGIFTNQPHELVGSAEQGFIYQAYNNQLVSNKLFSITPCFRSEEVDQFHQLYFMKVELFHLLGDEDVQESIFNMINMAIDFFKSIHNEDYFVVVRTSKMSFDILLNGIEIGSYGLRDLPGLSFIYGTGLALPRFEQAANYTCTSLTI